MKPNIERLNDLLAIVRRLDPKQFNMASYIGTSDCGTTYCAAGAYCAAHPERFNVEPTSSVIRTRPTDSDRAMDVESWFLGQEFGLGNDQVSHLFYAHGDITLHEYITRLEEFIAEHT